MNKISASGCLRRRASATARAGKIWPPVPPVVSMMRRDMVTPLLFENNGAGGQKGSPVEAYAVPEPGEMPGYPHEEIMAAGTFVTGATNELSCDGPLCPPYTAYMQGGLSYEYGKLGVLRAIDEMMDRSPED